MGEPYQFPRSVDDATDANMAQYSRSDVETADVQAAGDQAAGVQAGGVESASISHLNEAFAEPYPAMDYGPDGLMWILRGWLSNRITQRFRPETGLVRVVAVGCVLVVVAAGVIITALIARRQPPVNVDQIVPYVEGAKRASPETDAVPSAAVQTSNAAAAATAAPGENGNATLTTALVHVVGAVAVPGIYELPTGARVADAVQAAGGPVATADIEQINLAAPIVDGTQIRIPHEGEILAPAVADPVASANPDAGPLDLNRADARALESLPGVGPATAEAIVAWREENGPFGTLADIELVPGIGPAKREGLEGLVVVGP